MEEVLTRLHELTVIVYAFSILLYFLDFLQSNRKAKKSAFWLLVFVWLLQSVFFMLYMFRTGRFPVLTIFEGLYFYIWVLITLSLVIHHFVKVEFIVFFINVIGFVLMVIHTFAPMQYQSETLAEKLISELLLIHITGAFLVYGIFAISAVFSVLYLIQYDLLKRKKWGPRLVRIADLAKLDHMSYVLNSIGVPLLFLSLILGSVWAYIKVPNLVWYDAKVVGSFVVVFVYALYLFLRLKKRKSAKMLAFWNVASFLIVLINFFLFGTFSRFHVWYI